MSDKPAETRTRVIAYSRAKELPMCMTCRKFPVMDQSFFIVHRRAPRSEV
jgi:hypothetical protein